MAFDGSSILREHMVVAEAYSLQTQKNFSLRCDICKKSISVASHMLESIHIYYMLGTTQTI